MASGFFTYYLANNLLNYIFQGTPWSPSKNQYIAVMCKTPTSSDTGSTIIEPGIIPGPTNDYRRIEYNPGPPSSDGGWETLNGGAVAYNSSPITFDQIVTDFDKEGKKITYLKSQVSVTQSIVSPYLRVGWFGITDDPGAGNLYLVGPLVPSFQWTQWVSDAGQVETPLLDVGVTVSCTRLVSEYFGNLLLNYVLAQQPITLPNTVYVALLNQKPSFSDTGSTISEPSSTNPFASYARVSVQCNSTNWSTANRRMVSNLTPITFSQPTGDWGKISYVALCDQPTGGQVLFVGPMNPPLRINSPFPIAPSFAPYTLTIGLFGG